MCLGDKQNLNPCHRIVMIWWKSYYKTHHLQPSSIKRMCDLSGVWQLMCTRHFILYGPQSWGLLSMKFRLKSTWDELCSFQCSLGWPAQANMITNVILRYQIHVNWRIILRIINSESCWSKISLDRHTRIYDKKLLDFNFDLSLSLWLAQFRPPTTNPIFSRLAWDFFSSRSAHRTLFFPVSLGLL